MSTNQPMCECGHGRTFHGESLVAACRATVYRGVPCDCQQYRPAAPRAPEGPTPPADFHGIAAHQRAALAPLSGREAALFKLAERFGRDIRDGYAHEDDAHRYKNGACRVCNAEAFLTTLRAALADTDTGRTT